ncbi:MAG: hypothetical protein LUG99_00335 [Lachnospiraceae bacterium]|nr:hypothetical protein [Lachnospiraceae bacterium]
MSYVRKKSYVSAYEKPVVYMASDRMEIAGRYNIREKIQIEVIIRDALDKSLRTEIEICTVAGKYPNFLQYIDPKGISHAIDYFELDRMSKRIRTKGLQNV